MFVVVAVVVCAECNREHLDTVGCQTRTESALVLHVLFGGLTVERRSPVCCFLCAIWDILIGCPVWFLVGWWVEWRGTI